MQDLWASDQVLLETWIPSGLIRVNQGSESQGPFAGPDNQSPNNVPYLFERGKQWCVLDSRKSYQAIDKNRDFYSAEENRYYIGGGEEPLIATVEENADPRRQRHLRKIGERRRGIRKG